MRALLAASVLLAACVDSGRVDNRIRPPTSPSDARASDAVAGDAAPAIDAGEQDAGHSPEDAGFAPLDQGFAQDQGFAPDAIADRDAGFAPDARVIPDAGPGTPRCTPIGNGQPVNPTVGVTDASRVIRQSNLQRPGVGQSVANPDHGTTIRRLTNRSEQGANSFEVNIYSQLQAVSANNAYVLFTGDQWYTVRCTSDLTLVPVNLQGINNPRWHPTQPNVLVHYDTNAGTDFKVQTTNVDTGVTTDIGLVQDYVRIRPSQSFDEVSHDGRWIAGLAVRRDMSQEIFAYDLQNARLGARLHLDQLYRTPCTLPQGWDPNWGTPEPDWVAPSPLGDFLIVQWKADGEGQCRGMDSYDIATGRYLGSVHPGHPHGDLGLVENWQSAPANRRQFFMAYDINEGGVELSAGYRWLPGEPGNRVSVANVLRPLDWGNTGHISCQGPAGRCLLSAGPGNDTSGTTQGWQAFENEIYILDLNGGVRRLAHHRSSVCGYWAQPRATWSRDGRFVLWSSDWGNARCAQSQDGVGNADTFLIDLGP